MPFSNAEEEQSQTQGLLTGKKVSSSLPHLHTESWPHTSDGVTLGDMAFKEAVKGKGGDMSVP